MVLFGRTPQDQHRGVVRCPRGGWGKRVGRGEGGLSAPSALSAPPALSALSSSRLSFRLALHAAKVPELHGATVRRGSDCPSPAATYGKARHRSSSTTTTTTITTTTTTTTIILTQTPTCTSVRVAGLAATGPSTLPPLSHTAIVSKEALLGPQLNIKHRHFRGRRREDNDPPVATDPHLAGSFTVSFVVGVRAWGTRRRLSW